MQSALVKKEPKNDRCVEMYRLFSYWTDHIMEVLKNRFFPPCCLIAKIKSSNRTPCCGFILLWRCSFSEPSGHRGRVCVVLINIRALFFVLYAQAKGLPG